MRSAAVVTDDHLHGSVPHPASLCDRKGREPRRQNSPRRARRREVAYGEGITPRGKLRGGDLQHHRTAVALIQGRSDVCDETNSGCRGQPNCVVPRHCSGFRWRLLSSLHTKTARFHCRRLRAPNATTIESATAAAEAMAASFSSPMGFGSVRSRAGLGLRSAKRLTTSSRSKPHRCENQTQRRMVGSSMYADAVDGFSITHSTEPMPSSQLRTRLYRYRPHSDRCAARSTYPAATLTAQPPRRASATRRRPSAGVRARGSDRPAHPV